MLTRKEDFHMTSQVDKSETEGVRHYEFHLWKRIEAYYKPCSEFLCSLLHLEAPSQLRRGLSQLHETKLSCFPDKGNNSRFIYKHRPLKEHKNMQLNHSFRLLMDI